MKKLKKVFRLFSLVFFVALALMGLGGISIFSAREKYQNKSVRIELVDKREDEDESRLKDVE